MTGAVKSAFLLIFILFICNITLAQTHNSAFKTTGDSACEKINYPLPGTITTLTLTLTDGTYWGYISGNSLSGDKAKANYFPFDAAHPYIKGAWFEFGVATNASSSNPDITFGIWKFNNSKLDTTIVSSITIPIKRIIDDVNAQNETYIEFPSSVKVTGSYLIGVKLPINVGDTLALKSNKDDDTKPGTAWEQWLDDSWHQYSEPGCWYINISNAIYPLTCSQTTNISASATFSIANNIELYPNPAKDLININLEKGRKNVKISIYNIIGNIVKTCYFKGETNRFQISLNNLQKGIYYLNIQSNNVSTTRKFTIIN